MFSYTGFNAELSKKGQTFRIDLGDRWGFLINLKCSFSLIEIS